MNPKEILDPEAWAKKTFGRCHLKDLRRTGRAVKVAARLANDASASLPAQMQTWKETMALYRLLDEETEPGIPEKKFGVHDFYRNAGV